MKKLAILLLLVPLAFAQWEGIAGLTIGLSVTLIAILYAIGFGFDVNELKITAKEELFQVIALAVMLAVLVGANGLLNTISTNIAFTGGAATMQDAAQGLLTSDYNDLNNIIMANVMSLDKSASIEASRAGQCNILGMGYSVSGCGGFSMLATPLSMAGSITGFAITEVASMNRLIELSKTYALTMLLPLGILLRTFKITRGAGGFLIALAISLHIMLPAGVIFNEMLRQTFDDPSNTLSADYRASPSASIAECNAMDTNSGDEGNSAKAYSTYTGMRADIRAYMDTIMIRATLGPIIALLMFIASLRALTSLMGAEVDVSGIARFA